MSFKNNSQIKHFLSDIFFETGTYFGDAARAASDAGFKRVITVELQERLFLSAREMSKNYPKIEFHLGDSPSVMKEILPLLDGRITFWLDAHIDGGNYEQGKTPEIRPCPLYEELETIKKLKRKDHIILIDDMRIIGNVGWGKNTYKLEIEKIIKQINENYKIFYIDGYEFNDIMVAKI